MLFKNQDELKNHLQEFDLNFEDISGLIQETTSIQNSLQHTNSFVGGSNFFAPKDFRESELEENFVFLFQIDLEEVFHPRLPKTGLFTGFIYVPINGYSQEDFTKPLIKIFCFPKNSCLQKKIKTQFITEEKKVSLNINQESHIFAKLNDNSNENFRSHSESTNSPLDGSQQPFTIEKVQHEIVFPLQYICFDKAISLPKLDYYPNINLSTEIVDKYRLFEVDMIINQSKSGQSNLFGWSQNQQPINDELDDMKKFYQDQDSEIIHLLTFSSNLNLSLPAYLGPESVSIFLFKKDLESQTFNKAWLVICYD